jgi:predicted nucleic acid-binding protein
MNIYFIDTGYLIALEVANDQYHKIAKPHWDSLEKESQQTKFVTTSYIFDEAITFFKNRNRHQEAIKIGNLFLQNPVVEFIHVDKDLFYKGWEYLQKYEDKKYSFTDCVSFIVMQDKKIDTALTFDHNFTQAGFRKLP